MHIVSKNVFFFKPAHKQFCYTFLFFFNIKQIQLISVYIETVSTAPRALDCSMDFVVSITLHSVQQEGWTAMPGTGERADSPSE